MGLLLEKPVVVKSPSLLVPLESWLFLQNKEHMERSGKELSEKAIQRLTMSFQSNSYNGKKQILNYDFGGCNGPWENAWEERRWTNWSVNEVMRILDEANLPYEKGKDTEYIAI